MGNNKRKATSPSNEKVRRIPRRRGNGNMASQETTLTGGTLPSSQVPTMDRPQPLPVATPQPMATALKYNNNQIKVKLSFRG